MENVVRERTYYQDADIIRGFAILLVVLGHAVAKENILTSDNIFCNFIYDYIYSFHMPLFFIVSGFVFSAKESFKHHMWNIFRSLLIPYIFFNLFTIFLQQMIPFFSIEERTVAEQVKVMVLNGGNLWYIYVLIEFRILFYFIHKLVRSKLSYTGIVFMIFMLLATVKLITVKYFLFSSFILYAPFFTLGYIIRMMAGEKDIRISRYKKIWIGIFFLFLHFPLFYCKMYLAEKHPLYYLLYFGTALSGCIASYCLISAISCKKIREIFVNFGKKSFQIYIFNGYFISVSRTLQAVFFGINSVWILSVLNFIMGLIPNYYFSNMILKLSFIKYLFGKEKHNDCKDN